MAKRLPPLNPLKAFEATARHLSVGRAAAELSVTQSAVSHQLRTLEAALGVRLFERQGGRMRLTPQGAALMPPVSQAFDAIAEATARVARPSTEGDLVISCVPALLSFWLVPRLGAFTDAFPGVRLRLVPSNAPGDIYDPAIDVCVRYGDGNWADCWVRLLSTLELFPVASPTLVNNRPIRAVADLSDHVLLHADDGREWLSWLAASGATHLARGRQHMMSDAQLAMEAAMHGHGVALGDTFTASGSLAAGRLVVPFDTAVPAADAFYVACRTGMQSASMVRAFVDWLHAGMEEDALRAELPRARWRVRA